MADDRMLREMTSDPKFRKVLVTDGKTAVGQALVQALVKAGADIVWVGHAEPWKKLPGLDDITALPQVTLVPLDLTDGALGDGARRRDRRQGRHRGQQRRGAPRLRHRRARAAPTSPRAEMDINYFGLLRLAQEFGPALRAARPTAATQRGGLGQPAVDLRALELSAARHLLGLEGRRATRWRSACAPRCGRPASA